MMSVHEVCQATGVTRKRLFYYDQIGLLKPTRRIGPQKSKMYGPRAVARLNTIMRYQEAGLTLREITQMIDAGKEEQKQILHSVIERMEKEAEHLKEKTDAAKNMLAKMK